MAQHDGHLLQSWAWGELKDQFGWTPCRLQTAGAAAQILFRRLPLGLSIAYIPKGPLLDWADGEQRDGLFSAIHSEAKKRRAVFLKIEPDLWLQHPSNAPATALTHEAVTYLKQANFVPADTIQPQTSLVVDIRGDEDSILAAMKQKTRYNIRLAKKKGVSVRRGSEVDTRIFYDLSTLTAERETFGIHTLDYYQTAFQRFAPAHCALFIAEYQAEPLAALMAFSQGQTAYYFYGASSNRHRNLMAPYLVQWAAIQWAKGQGCTSYDLWGIPNVEAETLEAEFKNRQEGLWGVYRFKRGFGGEVVKSVGAFDYVYNPLLYKLYKLRR